MRYVIPDSLFGDHEQAGDLPVVESSGDQLEDLSFAIGQFREEDTVRKVMDGAEVST